MPCMECLLPLTLLHLEVSSLDELFLEASRECSSADPTWSNAMIVATCQPQCVVSVVLKIQ